MYSLFSPLVRQPCFLPLAQLLEPDPHWTTSSCLRVYGSFCKLIPIGLLLYKGPREQGKKALGILTSGHLTLLPWNF